MNTSWAQRNFVYLPGTDKKIFLGKQRGKQGKIRLENLAPKYELIDFYSASGKIITLQMYFGRLIYCHYYSQW